MQIDVVKNAKRNIAAGIFNKIVVIIFPFIVRTTINIYLGAEYLGLNSLFSSIISVLSLSELGFGSAIVYHMYKPIAENNVSLVCALLNFYRKAYIAVGSAILIIGLILVPVVPRLICGSYPKDINLIAVYLVFLANTTISYFMSAYLNSLLVVYQRSDVTSFINTVITIGLNLLQIIVVIITKNYFWYCILLPLSTIANNIWVYLFTRTAYPQYHCAGKLDKEHLQSIKKLLMGAFIQKASSVTRNALDSLCISLFLGLTLTAIYSNYFTILNSITAFMSILCTSVLGGIGNHIVIKKQEENFREGRL